MTRSSKLLRVSRESAQGQGSVVTAVRIATDLARVDLECHRGAWLGGRAITDHGLYLPATTRFWDSETSQQ